MTSSLISLLRYSIGCFLLLLHQAHAADARVDPQTLIVAGGCFWCVEADYEKQKGVLSAESGYINGHVPNPSYRQVASKQTGHYEAVKITYDANITSARTLVDFFWRTVDPTDPDGQFCDKGSPYKTGLFYQNEQQKQVFTASLQKINAEKPFAEPIVTPILAAQTFYPAEGYHQDYYKKNKYRYRFYRANCGRDARIKELWGEVVSRKP